MLPFLSRVADGGKWQTIKILCFLPGATIGTARAGREGPNTAINANIFEKHRLIRRTLSSLVDD
jgi:hypothetical protein